LAVENEMTENMKPEDYVYEKIYDKDLG